MVDPGDTEPLLPPGPLFKTRSAPLILIIGGILAVTIYALTSTLASPSTRSKLQTAVQFIHPGATCAKVGVMAFAGGRSDLYGCDAPLPVGSGRFCAVWANGSAYEVTKQARAIFRLQGQPSPC